VELGADDGLVPQLPAMEVYEDNGWPPPKMGCFEVHWASVAPPDELLLMIWPELDAWKERFGLQADQINDLATMGLTDLLFYL